MQIIQSRRDFLAGLSAAGAAGVLGGRASLADEAPPETTTIRIAARVPPFALRRSNRRGPAACGRVHRYPLRGRAGGLAYEATREERGLLAHPAPVIVFHLDTDAPITVGRRAWRLLRTVRARVHPNHQRPEGQERIGIRSASSSGHCTWP